VLLVFELAVLKQGAVIDQRFEVHGAHSKKKYTTVSAGQSVCPSDNE